MPSGVIFHDNERPFLEAVAFLALAVHLAGAAHGFGSFALFLLRWFFVVAAELHLTKEPFALHFFLQCAQSLFHVVIAYMYANQ